MRDLEFSLTAEIGKYIVVEAPPFHKLESRDLARWLRLRPHSPSGYTSPPTGHISEANI